MESLKIEKQMTNEPVFITEAKDFRLPEPLQMDCGKVLKEVNIRYETAGTLNADRSNAVLVNHALTGDAHVCGRHTPEDKKPGWWDEMIGPGKMVDTNKYFVICSNVIKNGRYQQIFCDLFQCHRRMFRLNRPAIH